MRPQVLNGLYALGITGSTYRRIKSFSCFKKNPVDLTKYLRQVWIFDRDTAFELSYCLNYIGFICEGTPGFHV